jgi:hypothetical protein
LLDRDKPGHYFTIAEFDSYEEAITVLFAGALIATWAGAWKSIGHFFTTLSASGLTGVLAALTAALLVGGFATIRRVAV